MAPDECTVRFGFVFDLSLQFVKEVLIYDLNGVYFHVGALESKFDTLKLSFAGDSIFRVLKFHYEGTTSTQHAHIDILSAAAVQNAYI